MSALADKVKTSIERLRAFEPRNGEGYYLAFSGGKDSVVCKALMDMAGVKYDATYRLTSVDPPELVYFIRDKHPDVKIEKPRYTSRRPGWEGKQITMMNLIPWKLMPPTRLVRYCCEFLKESGGDGRKVVTGVRWAESRNRQVNQGIVSVFGKTAANELADGMNFSKNKSGGVVLTNDNEETRRMVEQCYKRHKTSVNPIIDWTDDDVWGFVRGENIPYCGLYDCGLKRLGCIGCPMGGRKNREREFALWPKYKHMYLRAFAEMLEERKRRGKTDGTWRSATALDVFNWWMEYSVLPGQSGLFEEEELYDGLKIEKVKAIIKDGWTKNIAEAIPKDEV